MDYKQMLKDLNKSVDLNGEEKSVLWASLVGCCLDNEICSFYKNKVFLIIPANANSLLEYMNSFDLLPSVAIPIDFSSVKEIAEELNYNFLLCYDLEDGIGIPLFSVQLPIFHTFDDTDLRQFEAFDKLINTYDEYVEEQIKNDTTLIIEDNDK